MITQEAPNPTRFRYAAPVLCVNDIRPMLDYFEQRLGFHMQGSAGDLPSWASMQRDGVEIMLVCGNYPAAAQDWAAYIYVTDADALYSDLKARGAELVSEPADKPYNIREFETQLPDGRLLAFGADFGSSRKGE